MLKEIGVVKEIKGDSMVILVEQGKQCEACEARGGCSLGSKGRFELEMGRVPGIEKGYVIELEIPSRDILKLSFLVYFLPVLGFVLGAGLVYYLSPEWVEKGLISILGGVGLMFLTFLPLKRYDKKARASARYSPKVTRVIERVKAQ